MNLDTLTQQEQAVFQFLVDGLSIDDICKKLTITRNTANRHCKHVYHKCKVKSKFELAARYWKLRAVENEKAPATSLDEINYDVLTQQINIDCPLPPRHFQIVELLAQGRRYSYIRQKLDLSPKTLAQYMVRIRNRLKLRTVEEISEWFNKNFPTAQSRVLGYISACVTVHKTWLEAHEKKVAKKEADITFNLLVQPAKQTEKELPEDTLTPAELRVCAALVTMNKPEVLAHLKITELTYRKYINSIGLKTSQSGSRMIALWYLRKYPTPEAVKAAYEKARLRSKQSLMLSARKAAVTRSLGR